MSKDDNMFKIVTKIEGELYSMSTFLYRAEEADWVVNYRPGEWAFSDIGPLFVFNSLTSARNFLVGLGVGGVFGKKFPGKKNVEIWTCEIEGEIGGIPDVLFSPSKGANLDGSANGDIKSFWEDPSAYKDGGVLMKVPSGTVLCQKLKLIERVMPV